ncbi:MAG: hypothetical protein CME26_17630 [Gemmatimonadetes bacterium]|nr:hypothetical protein [Gemmatimonadota bacterium]
MNNSTSPPDLLLTIDQEGQVGVANARYTDILGYAAADLRERAVSELLEESSRSGFEVVLRGVREGPTCRRSKSVYSQPTGGTSR